ncbi:MAG: MFS transporter [Bacteroidetes bacterium]|nr:MFS transporter [Bacteroidota bacterium]
MNLLASKIFSRTVWILCFVSLFNDIASEMLYPILPVYLKEIGFSVFLIGLLEGLADVTSGISKGYFGKLSDISGRRLPFIRSGYLLSVIAKPMFGMFINPVWIFFARTFDRFGKGIRTSARDAMLSDETTKENKGKVFGLHRGMDTTGAFIGPIFALVYIYFNPGDYKTMFFLAFAPGAVGLLLTFLIKEKKHTENSKKADYNFFSFLKYWKNSPAEYKKVVIGFLFFALMNSSDIFLLLKVKSMGYDDTYVIGAYIFYNFIYAVVSYPAGVIADKLSMKTVFISGMIMFAVVYFLMSLELSFVFIIAAFVIYGLFAASTEGISKAWITNIVSKEDTGTALGFFLSFNSICAMLASAMAGFLWSSYSPSVTFTLSYLGAIITAFYFIFMKSKKIAFE